MTWGQDGGFYERRYSCYGQHIDAGVEPQRPEMIAEPIVPYYAGPYTL
jgi:hypothetical protein